MCPVRDGLEQFFAGRRGAAKKKLLENGGGSDKTETAVAAALDFLVRVQKEDGSWALDDDGPEGGRIRNDTAATGFALLAFLGTGRTHRHGAKAGDKTEEAVSAAVEKGLQFLLKRQSNKTGEFDTDMYAHAIATLAVCEAYGMSVDPKLRGPGQRGLVHIVYAQHADGGWRYRPKQPGDTSVSGWQIVALDIGRIARLDVPNITINKSIHFLDTVCDPANEGYGYTGPGSTPTLTAVGLLCRQHLQAWGPENARLQKALAILDAKAPSVGDMYYTYFATNVLRHVGGKRWQDWNEKMMEALLGAQEKDGPLRGSFRGAAGHVSGRLMQTCLCLWTLEVYYRHPPRFVGDR
ncbi:MAG: prenyltransferase/squalene oxidase repeat-containing protein [Gemmataceae bacterium]